MKDKKFDHVHQLQWLQLAIHHGFVTLDGSHMHWKKQKDLKVMLEPKSCTLLPGTHCIVKIDIPSKTTSQNGLEVAKAGQIADRYNSRVSFATENRIV